MIDFRNLINQLPYYFKERDSYKNESGQGLLERFLQVPGEYLKDDISIKVDGIVDELLDFDTMDPKLINFIWEFMGSVPYSYGALLDNNLDLYGNNSWKEITNDDKPRARYRDLLKHVISLYKIRGSLAFYPALLNFYGFEATVRDPTGDLLVPDSNISTGTYIPEYDVGLVYDAGIQYDISNISQLCIVVQLDIGVDLLSNEITSEFKSRVYMLLNKYRPVNIAFFNETNVNIHPLNEPTGFTYIFPFQLS